VLHSRCGDSRHPGARDLVNIERLEAVNQVLLEFLEAELSELPNADCSASDFEAQAKARQPRDRSASSGNVVSPECSSLN
jgi:hypothetical protein